MTTENETTGSDQNNNAPSWWIDEGIPGIGEKPAWLGEKFKSVADLATSYNELEKRVGTVPDHYDFSKSKSLDPEYAAIKEFQEFARSKRVPQDVMDKMIDAIDKYHSEFATDMQAEMAALGENAKERLTVLTNWAQANLSKDSFEALTMELRSANSIKAMEELRSKLMSNQTTIPNGNQDGASGAPTLAEVQEELNNNLPKYKTDPKYRQDITRRLEAASKQSNFVDKAW